MKDELQTLVAIGGNEAQINQPDPTPVEEDSFVEYLRPYLGDDELANAAYLRRKIINDEDYINNIASQIVAEMQPSPNYYQGREEEHLQHVIKVKNRIYETLSVETHTGETLQEAIVKRSVELQRKEKGNPTPVASYKNIIKSNYIDFKNSGFFDEDKNFIANDRVLITKLENDEDFLNKLTNLNYEGFTEALTKTHNIGGVDVVNINDMASAYSIYEQFGSEGLTHFVNWLQRPALGEDGEYPTKVKDAIEFLRTAKKDGKTPLEYIQNFYGSEDSELGKFSITPLRKSFDLENKIERDANAYTNFFYRTENEDEAAKYFISQIRSNKDLSTFGRFMYDRSEHPKGATLLGAFWDLGLKLQKGSIAQYLPTYWDISDEKVLEEVTKGQEGHNYRFFRNDILTQAEKGELFTINDLFRTIALNSRKVEQDGIVEYFVDYDNLDTKTRWAVDSLMFSDKYDNLFRERGDQLIFQPNVQQQVQNTYLGKAFGNIATEPVPVYDENNQFVGMGERPSTNALPAIYDAVAGFTWEMGKLILNTLGELFAFDRVMDSTIEKLEQSGLEDTAYKIEDWYGKGRTILDTDIQREGVAANIGAFGGMIAGYIGTSYNAGRSGIYAIKSLSTARKGINIGNASLFLKGKNGTKWAAIAERMVQKHPKAIKGALFTAKTDLGAAMLAGAAPENYSPLAVGGFELVDEYLGISTDVAKQNYETSNRLVQAGTDFLVTEALAIVFDGLFGAARYGKGLLTGKSKGIRLNTAGTDFVTNTGRLNQEFTTDLRRLYSYLLDDLGEKPIGMIEDAVLKNMNGHIVKEAPENIYTFADFVVKFIDEGGEFMSNLKQTINDSVEFYDTKLNLKKMSQEELDNRTQQIYDGVINKLGKELSDMLSQGNDPKTRQFALQFSDLLMDEAPVFTKLHYTTDKGKIVHDMGFVEAQQVAMGNPFAVIKQNKNGKYNVGVVDGNYWTVDLAKSVRENFINNSQDATFLNYLKRRGIDPNSTDVAFKELISEERAKFNRFYGQQVEVEEGVYGRVVDIDKDGYVVAKDTGELVTAEAPVAYKEGLDDISPKKASMKNNEVETSIGRIEKQTLKAIDFDKIPDAKNVLRDDEVYAKTGVRKSYWDRINKEAGYKTQTSSTARTMLKNIGSDGSVDYNIIGKNATDIEIYDASKIGKKGIPTNTVVQTKAGNTINHFISNQKTPKEIPPSVWLEDANGKLVRNENWSRIDKNKTFKEDGTPQFYVAEEIDGERWYRLSKNGRGKILNIQQPTIKENLDNTTIIRDNIDGYYKEIDGVEYYKPISEADQVVNASAIMGKRPTPEVKVKKKEVPKEDIQKEAENALKINFLPPQAIGALGGYFASQILSTEDNSVNPLPWMGIGALAGTKGVYKPINHWIKGAAETVTSPFPKNASRQLAKSKRLEAQKHLTTTGLSKGGFNIDEVNMMDEFVDDVGSVPESGIKNVFRKIKDVTTNNRLFQSAFGFLESLNISKAVELRDHLFDIGNTIQKIGTRASKNFEQKAYQRRFNAFIEEGLDPEEAKSRALSEVRGFDDWYESEGRIRDFDQALSTIGIEMPDETGGLFTRLEQFLGVETNTNKGKKDYFGEAYSRIMHAGFVDENDVLLQNVDNVTVSTAYNNNPKLLELDRELLKQDNFKDFIASHRDAYTTELNDYIKTLDDQARSAINRLREAENITDAQVQLFVDLDNFDGSVSDFRKGLAMNKKQTFDKLKIADDFRDIVEAKNLRRKMTNLDRKYLPQMVDRNRYIADQKAFIEREGLEGLTQAQKDAAYSTYMSDKIFNMNLSDEAKKTLQKFNPDEQTLETKTFTSAANAAEELRRIASRHTKNTDTELEAGEILGRINEFIKEIKRNGKSKYIIEIDDPHLKGVLNLENKFQNRKLFDEIKKGALIQHSNFLENPRIKNLPLEIIETDPYKLRQKYAYDVGRRLHSRQAGIYNQSYLRDKFFDPIIEQLESKGVDKVDQHMNRIEGIWNTMYGMIGKNAGEIRSEMRAQQFTDTISKLLFSVFGFGFGKYNFYEWAVVSPQISSWNSVKNTVQLYGKDTNALKNMEDFLLNENIIRKQIGSFKPEYEGLNLSEATERDIFSWTENWANRWANLAGSVSLGKFVAQRFGSDMSGAGLARLLPIVGDSFVGGNIVASSINARAALGEANQLAKIRRALVDGAEIPENLLPKNVDTSKYTVPEVDRLLKDLGVNDPEEFMINQGTFEQGLNSLDASPNFSQEMMVDNPSYYEDIRNIVSYATQTFHGTNRMFRPEGWNTAYGRLASTYLTYPFNIARQMVKQRMYDPLRNWRNKYKQDLGYINAMDITLNKRRGNYKYLQDKYGIASEAIDEFPDHVAGAFQKAAISVGVSFAGALSVGAIQDMLSFPFVDDEYQWYQTKRNLTLNPADPEDEQITLGEVFQSLDEFKTWNELAMFGLANVARTGYFGVAGSPIESTARGYNLVDRDGVMTVLPLASVANDIFKGIVNTVVRPQDIDLSGVPETVFEWTPILGSSYFSDVKRSIFSENNKNKIKIRTSTGEDLSFEDINLNNEL